ncbi:MAG: PAS domain-containing sensor histidine kinase [Tindallia sp. MSAO_Bac2]|nr:MAG: PAS domain-containing sensor histidine kinase [Tindallia sp. MSAO_Bac2]
MIINPEEILHHTTDIVTIIDAYGICHYISPSCIDILGYTPEELEGGSIFELMHNEDVETAKKAMNQSFMGISQSSLRYRIKHCNGHYVSLESSGNGKTLESYDKPMRLITSRDITKQVEMEKTVIEGELKFRHIMEAAQDAIVLMNDDGCITGWNKSAQRIFGYSSDEVLGKDLHITLCPEHYKQKYKVNLDHFRNTGKGRVIGRTVELKGKKKNGIIFPIELSLSAFQQDGRFHSVGIVRDITDRKAAENELLASKERAEKANTVKNAFLANMSHELRTPLHGILGMLTMMDETMTSEEQQELLGFTKESANHLMELVDDLLRLTKLHNGSEVLKESNFEFQEMIRSSLEPFYRMMEVKNIEFIVTDEDLSNIIVKGDRDKLVKTICHLLTNAIKFTKEGRIEIISILKEYTDDIGVFRIEVKDTGIGVSYGDIPYIFDPFYQSDETSTKIYGGAGIGLPLSRQYIEMMGGTIGVKSEEGEGSSFFFEVPLKISKESHDLLNKSGRTKSTGKKLKPFEKSLKILIADDDEPTRVLMKKLMDSFNLESDFVANGLDAVQYYTHNQYDLVLMDIQMPMMDGFDAVQLIREYESETGNYTPIIALSAYSMEEDLHKYYSQGFDDVLTKPIELEKIYGVACYWTNPAHHMR